MSAAAYYKAAIPTPYTVLGRRLKPFSLGHFLLMQRFGCAYASDTPVEVKISKAGLGEAAKDLILAVLICSKTYEEFLDFIESHTFEKEVAAWRKSVGPFNILHKVGLFKQYIAEHSVEPKYWEEKTNPKQSGAHWTQAVKITLTGQLGYTETEALNCSLSKALADFYKHAENQGAVSLMTDDEIEAVNRIERKDAQCQLQS